ncbi:MAG TPA: DUF2244 domain-containing protein [Stellaceae bacterium]|nr:DUF2244 domain-containing protein [Stellaceae bacterium]
MTGTPSDPVLFSATVAPHRSLPPRGLTWIMAVLIGFCCCTSIGFVLAGAWPVTGFFGLDIALLYLAFRLSYRSARQKETLRLTPTAFDVERLGVRGERRRWRFEPAWLRVSLEEEEDGRGRLRLGSHGRSVTVGAFLTAEERQNLASGVKAALQRWREALRS